VRTLDLAQFEVTIDVRGQRVLLVDDTFTTGASLFSATAALRRAGATVAGPLVLARHVQESWVPSQEMMSWLSDRTWDEHRCCRRNGEQRDAGALF
jgi:adenine/guanine phosphoribosyltransferase-like PRPP-binding protein